MDPSHGSCRRERTVRECGRRARPGGRQSRMTASSTPGRPHDGQRASQPVLFAHRCRASRARIGRTGRLCQRPHGASQRLLFERHPRPCCGDVSGLVYPLFCIAGFRDHGGGARRLRDSAYRTGLLQQGDSERQPQEVGQLKQGRGGHYSGSVHGPIWIHRVLGLGANRPV